MKKRVLIVADSLEIGGIERSLICMLKSFDYDKYDVDLMLYSKHGELLDLVDEHVNLIDSCDRCKTFGIPVKEVVRNGYFSMAFGRITANVITKLVKVITNQADLGYYQTQLMYKLTHSYLKSLDKVYDVAIGYAWPHDFIISKVKAKTKIGWIHTDYSTISVNKKIDLKMWRKLDYIISISDDCTKTFLKQYPSLSDKVVRMDNIISPDFIKRRAEEPINEMDRNTFNILSIGRICHQKGFDWAVQALRELRRKGYTNIKWYIVGFGPDEKKIKLLINQYKLEEDFLLLGKKVNPYPYLKACNLYVQPSRYEGKAVTIQEAKILGKPIIVTNYETSYSQIEDGFDGIITDMSINGLVGAIEKLYVNEELRGRLEKNCTELVLNNEKGIEKIYSLM
ncbi:glycosyltransferase [Clostridium culturomicium]|uniref:glycosyltransferase n=1 Tax=Clostridium culturomicium TaxID=1499683 RepID=UPI00058B4AA1|nr:glycosyltransferase [Clostridium culturomicium]